MHRQRIAAFFFPALTFFFALLIAPGSAGALSDGDYQRFITESPAFRQAETNLNATWKRLTSTLPEDRMAKIREAQRDWVRYTRDPKAEKLAREKKIPLPEAYARVTAARVEELRAYLPADSGGGGLAGRYDSGMGLLVVEEPGPGQVKIHLTTDWPPQQCSGEVGPTVLRLNGDTAILSDDRCPKLVFSFRPGLVEVEEEGACGYHGMNCYFDGEYKKVK